MVLVFMFAASWRLTVVTFVLVPCVLVISKVRVVLGGDLDRPQTRPEKLGCNLGAIAACAYKPKAPSWQAGSFPANF
jgi:hypothetical protein